MNQQHLLTEQEAAEYLSLSRSYLAQSRCYGSPEGPPFIRLGRAIRYCLADLDAFIADRRKDVSL